MTWLEDTWLPHNRPITAPDLYYCFVNIRQDTRLFRFFIIPSQIGAKYIREQHQYWLGTKESGEEPATVRRFRLGLDRTPYRIDSPLADDYEDQWDFEFAD